MRKVFDLGDGIVIKTGKLNHPNGACGYRIEFGGKVLAICTILNITRVSWIKKSLL